MSASLQDYDQSIQIQDLQQLNLDQKQQDGSQSDVQDGAALVQAMSGITGHIATMMSENTNTGSTDSVGSVGASSGASSTPSFANQIENDLQQIEEAEEAQQEAEQQIQQLAKELTTSGLDPLEAAMVLMQDESDVQGDQMATLANVNNLSSDITSAIGSVQNDMNTISNGGNSGSDQDVAQNMINSINWLDNFFKSQEGGSAISSSSLSNFESGLNNFTSAFGDDWGQSGQVMNDITTWTTGGDGQYNQQYSDASNGLTTMSSTANSVSTATGTEEQYQTNLINQTLGTLNSEIQSAESMFSTFTNNQRSS